MLVRSRLQLGVQTNAAVDTNDVAFLKLRFDFPREHVAETPHSVMIFLNHCIMIDVCCVDTCRCQSELCHSVFKNIARLYVMHNADQRNVVDCFWCQSPESGREDSAKHF